MKRIRLFVLLCAGIGAAIGAGAAHAQNPSARCQQSSMTIQETHGPVTITVIREGDLNLGAVAIFRAEEQLNPPEWKQTWFLRIPFPAGVDHVTSTMPFSNDGVYIGDRNLHVFCGAEMDLPGGGRTVSGETITIKVLEDEPFPTVHFAEELRIREGEKPIAIFTVTPPVGRTTTAFFSTDNGTASLGSDFDWTQTGALEAESTTGWVKLPTFEDDLPESDETFTLHFLGLRDAANTFTVTILDDDQAPFPIALEHSSYDFTEGATNAVKVMRGGNLSLAGTATLHVETGTPQLWPADATIAFAPGEASKTILMPFDDQQFSGNRIATLRVVATNGFVAATVPLTMTDDDFMPVLSIAGVEVVEGAAGATQHAEVLLTLTAPLAIDLAFDVATLDGTANATDYTPLAKRVFFAPGALSQKISIDIHGDDTVEPDETFKVRISNCCASLAFLEQHEATVVIRNDDDGTPPDNVSYRFERPLQISWSEAEKWLTATVVRSGNISQASTVQARLTADPRTFAPLDVRFRANETSKIVRFFIDDPFYSGGSIGALELFVGTRREDTFRIGIDDDEPKPVLTIADVHVAEGPADRKAAVVITVTPPSLRPIATKLQLEEFSIVAAQDLIGLRNGQDVVIPALRSSFNIDFWVRADKKNEPEEFFRLNLIIPAPVGQPAPATAHSSGMCSIRDYDTLPSYLTMPDGLARGATATITLTLAQGVPFDTPLAVRTSTPDLVSVPSTVNVLGGKNTATFEITALHAGDASIEVQLPRSNGAVPVPTLRESLFIYNVLTPIVPGVLRVKVGETASMKIALSEPAGEDVRVAVSSSDRSIAAAADLWATVSSDSGSIDIYGASVGHTMLAITLPSAFGGTTAMVPVEVTDPGPGRARAARH